MEASERCPECGTRVTERGVPRPPGWFHWRVAVPLLLGAAVVAAIAVSFWQSRWQTGTGAAIPAVREPEFTQPVYSIGEVRAIAEGRTESPPGRLARALMDRSNEWLVRPPGDEYLMVMAHPADATWMTRRWYGWPWPVARRDTSTEYVDVHKGEEVTSAMAEELAGVIKWSPGSRVETLWDAQSLVVVKLGGMTPFSRETTVVQFAPLVGMLVFPLAGWYMAVVGARVAWKRRLGGWRGRSVRACGAAAATALVLVMSMTGWRERGLIRPGAMTVQSLKAANATARSDSTMYNTGTSYAMIREMSGRPDGDRAVAQRLIGAFVTGGSDEMLLGVTFVEDSARSGTSVVLEEPWNLAELQSVQRWRVEMPSRSVVTGGLPRPGPDAERVTWPAAAPVWRVYDGALQVALPRRGPTQELRALTVYPGGMALVVVMVWAAWALGRWACERRARLVVQRHIAAGECVVCGYSLEDRGELVTPS